MTSGQHLAALPELLLDRSLGGIAVPALLRAAGLRVHTLAEIYPSGADDDVDDAEWLRYAGQRGWPVLLKDQRIRYRAVERAAISAHGITAFCLTGGDLRPAVLAEQFLNVLDKVALACARPGPALLVISASGMRSVPLDP
jgi:hypothetical protein